MFVMACPSQVQRGEPSVAVWVDLAWGALTLALLSAEQAVVEQRAVGRRIARTLGLALIIIANSALAGSLVARLKD